MNRKFFLIALGIMSVVAAIAQPAKYTTANLHAHNDYDYNTPFVQAYGLKLGSIEADVFWVNDTLFVAHRIKELKRNVLFESSYLQKLEQGIKANQGLAYTDKNNVLQLLIDIKTDSLQTLKAVINSIRKYPLLQDNPSIRFVITGSQVPAAQFDEYPAYILFDGKLNDPSHEQHLNRIGLFSANFANYSKWKGEGEIPAADLALLKKDIAKAHSLKKQIRFWGVPDTEYTWKKMMELGVDYINTDRIAEAARFISQR
jgi:alkaline phosphatase